jgi:hypothetical protein
MSTRQPFDYPTWVKTLEHLSSYIHEGRGFVVLRGLDPTTLSRQENVILYLGISSYFAEERGRQSP